MKKPLIIHIHGGTPFDSRDQYLAFIEKYYDPLEHKKRWPEWMQEVSHDRADVWLPTFPAKDNADYDVWKIAMDKIVKQITISRPVIFTARSLGTVFLMQYLSESLHHASTVADNIRHIEIRSIHLIGCVFDGEGITEEGMANFVLDSTKLSAVSREVQEIHLWHSIDDPICPWYQVEKYQRYLPDAILHRFEDRGHFGQEQFPELLAELFDR